MARSVAPGWGIGLAIGLTVGGLVGLGWWCNPAGIGAAVAIPVAPVDPPSSATPGASVPGDQGRGAADVPAGAVDPAKDRRVDEAIRRAQESTATVVYETRSQRRVASGVVLNDQGEVLSIFLDPPADRNRPSIQAQDASGLWHAAHWIGTDAETGLTLLRIANARLRPIRQAAGNLSLGADIFLVSNPYGLGRSVSRGHIAGLNRQFVFGGQTLGGLIQLQAPLHPGDSGALLADLDGGWLGLVRGTLATPDDNNVGFAIPARDALWIADRLRASGKVDRAYLGLRFAPDFEPDHQLVGGALGGVDTAGLGGGERAGARVSAVIPGSPADRAGLQVGDRVVQVDDQPVLVAADLTGRLDRTAAGTVLELDCVRKSERFHKRVPTTSRPTPPPSTPEVPYLIARPGPVAISSGAAPAASAPAVGRDDESLGTSVRTLRDRVDRLEQRVRQLEREGQARRGGDGH